MFQTNAEQTSFLDFYDPDFGLKTDQFRITDFSLTASEYSNTLKNEDTLVAMNNVNHACDGALCIQRPFTQKMSFFNTQYIA